MTQTKLSSLTVTSKGQVTLSAEARRQLKIDKGDTLIEMLVGKCLVLLPESQVLSATMRKAQAALKAAGVKPEDILEEAKHVRKSKLKERYPGL